MLGSLPRNPLPLGWQYPGFSPEMEDFMTRRQLLAQHLAELWRQNGTASGRSGRSEVAKSSGTRFDGKPLNRSAHNARPDWSPRPNHPRVPRRVLLARMAGDPPSDPGAAGDVRTDRRRRPQHPRAAHRIDCALLETRRPATWPSILDDPRRISRLRAPARPLPCADSIAIRKRSEELGAANS